MVVTNAMEHYYTGKHPDVREEWIVRAIAEPNHIDNDGDDLYFSYVPEVVK